jgi:radical SAM family RiPP maturation amino acid epimerase
MKAVAYKNFLDSLSARQRTDFAQMKRFLERWSGDPDFRKGIDLADGSREFIKEQLGFDFDVTELAPLIDVHAAALHITEEEWPLVHLWRKYIASSGQFRHEVRDQGNSGGVTPAFDMWRTRQMNRAAFDLGLRGASIVHAPIAFELSDGCSVGCWFCGISANKFKGHFDANDSGALELWKNVLTHSREVLGTGVAAGFCYWATDPMDNPSYCELADTFAEVMGSYPQITTAIPLRDIEFTKRALLGGKGVQLFPNRFSILTTSILRKVHQAFTPEELLGVELVLQNKGALKDVKAVAGKARSKRKTIPITSAESGKDSKASEQNSTIACVSGFLVNMVAKTIKLISPTTPTDKTPNGYYVLDSVEFSDDLSYRDALRSLIDRNMNPKISTGKKVRFVECVEVVKDGGGIELSSLNFRASFPHSDELIDAIQQGTSTPREIIKTLANQKVDPLRTIYLIESLWKGGLIESAA